MAAAAEKVGRDADEIKLIAVSKTHLAAAVQAAIDAGQYVFGENRVQEAEEKRQALSGQNAEWHLIGHLQGNKARRAVQTFDVIQSVDSLDLAQRLDRICGEEGIENLDVMIQVDLAGEATKSGISAGEVFELAQTIKDSEHLTLIGLMILPPYDEDVEKVRPYFKKLAEIGADLKKNGFFENGRCELSMGMSHDFETAIEEGATMVRVGTAIFGDR